MRIRELSIGEFNEYVHSSSMGTYYQTLNYAQLLGEYGYDYDFIGYVNEYEQIKAASLIVIRTVNRVKYGYAPRGFVMDYFNKSLVKAFSEDIINYYKKKKLVFIKLNPEVIISEVDPENGLPTYNWNYEIRDILEDNGYLKLKDNLYFESTLPRYQAIVSLKYFGFDKISKNTRNKVRKGITKGLHYEVADASGIDILNRFIVKKKHIKDFYYKDYYHLFQRDGMIDLFLVSVDSSEYLINSRKLYEEELNRNQYYQEMIKNRSSQKNINIKMESDRQLLAYKNDIEIATKLNKTNDKLYIAGALVMKYQNRVHILISGYDTKYKHFDPNYYLHYVIMDYYKDEFDYIDLNGVTGDFSKENPYHGLNQFKIGFNPRIYEYIGEYDLPIKKRKYYSLRKNGTLAKIFNKTDIKVIKNEKKELPKK